MTLRDSTDEIVWESWEARPKVRPGLYYVVENPGQVEPHKNNMFNDSHDFYIKGEPTTRISQVRKDTDMPEFLPKPMKLDEVVESNSKYSQVYAVVLTATPKSVYNEIKGKAKQELRIIDDTGTSMPLILLEMQYTDSFLAGDVLAIRYPDKATINNEPGLSAFATHVATGIGSPRENKLMVCTPKLTTMSSRRRMPKKKSMQQISQRTNSRSRKKIPMSSRSSWRPTQPNIRSTTESLKRSERKKCSWSPPQEEQLQDSKH